tara:strand:+ start:2372 stop:3376 length:1005 start_codon:yes stop_codon:yes gene_type:complete
MNKNIEQLLIKIELKGDVIGVLPIYNYNYNLINKSLNKGGNIYLPTEIFLTEELFKLKKDTKISKDILEKLRKVFTSEDSLKKLYEENSDKMQGETNKLLENNLNFIINLFFKKGEDFYLKGNKFIINSKKNLTDKNLGKLFKKNQYLNSKLCSPDKINASKCNFDNLENELIDSYMKKEIKFIKKIDPSLSDEEVNKKAYKEAIDKYKKGNQEEQIKNFANTIIEKEDVKNDLKKAGIKYIYKKDKGIILDINNTLREEIIVELDLTYSKNVAARRKFYIERGNCKSKKNYIKQLWKKLTQKNRSVSSNEELKKWKYEKTSNGYDLLLIKNKD